MAYRVQQFRYYGRDNVNNYPSNITVENLKSGSIFKNYTPIVQLGVQFAKNEGLKFYINGSSNPIYTGYYGLYELDLTGMTSIRSLRFDEEQLIKKDFITEEQPLIIDIVYEG